jgi:hypothetical protein
MTTYTNAPAPHSAYLDNAPTAPVPQRAHTTPATRIYQDGKGCWCSHDVTMQYGAPVPLALAVKRVQIGRTVFVQPGDAAAVLDAARGGGDGETVP